MLALHVLEFDASNDCRNAEASAHESLWGLVKVR
jgi:hypothetical protein